MIAINSCRMVSTKRCTHILAPVRVLLLLTADHYLAPISCAWCDCDGRQGHCHSCQRQQAQGVVPNLPQAHAEAAAPVSSTTRFSPLSMLHLSKVCIASSHGALRELQTMCLQRLALTWNTSVACLVECDLLVRHGNMCQTTHTGLLGTPRSHAAPAKPLLFELCWTCNSSPCHP